jgi:Lar family restriction alleviation protein
MTDLKPCPFCGGEAQRKTVTMPHQHGWVGCPKCGCYISWNHDPAKAIEKWNRRVEHG